MFGLQSEFTGQLSELGSYSFVKIKMIYTYVINKGAGI